VRRAMFLFVLLSSLRLLDCRRRHLFSTLLQLVQVARREQGGLQALGSTHSSSLIISLRTIEKLG